MTLTTLLINIGIAAIIATLLVIYVFKKHKSYVMTFIQNYCGILFIFSGWVKAVDPLGTAYKMEQYFDEFYSTFEGTWFSFLAPMFPALAEKAIWFSVIMIIFEIVLGVMLVIGAKPKFTSWAFFLLVAFFTFLTGFTYLTGYVPQDVNFFEFGSWAAYDANNMKVTDCGCFGDFIKLEPKTSFFKDVALLFPSIFFLFKHKKMHQLFTKNWRNGITAVTALGLLVYCFSNYTWDLPHTDFRPFKKGADVRGVRAMEEQAMADVKIEAWKLKSTTSDEIITVPNQEYMTNYSSKYKGNYKVLEQVQGKPAIKPTKISEFEVTDLDGNDLTESILNESKAHFLIVNYMLKGDPKREVKMVKDSLFVLDTVEVKVTGSDAVDTVVMKKFDKLVDREEEFINQNWKKSYLDKHIKQLKPFTDQAKENGFNVLMAIGKSDPEAIADFNNATGLDIQYGMADDILLKTIVRSNPGVVLWKDGKILDKWHIKKLPSFDKVAEQYLK